MAKGVVVISFEIPKDLHTGVLWQRAADVLKPLFLELEDARLYIAINEPAEAVIAIFDTPTPP